MTQWHHSACNPTIEQQQASDPKSSVWVDASAGTGKTQVLTDRVLRLLLNGAPAHGILCLTYTRAAATQMALRISRTLSDWATVNDDTMRKSLHALTGTKPSTEDMNTARRLFALVMECPGGMTIQTIHAFCHALLRRFPLEAGLPPYFELMDDSASFELLRTAQTQVFTKAQKQPESQLKKAINCLVSCRQTYDQYIEMAKEMRQKSNILHDIFQDHGGIHETINKVYHLLDVSSNSDDLIKQACDSKNVAESDLYQACDVLITGSEKDQKRSQIIKEWLDSSQERRIRLIADYQTAFLTKEGKIRAQRVSKQIRDSHLDLDLNQILDKEAIRLYTLQDRRNAVSVAEFTQAWLIFADSLLSVYEELKQRQALLDYDDLLRITKTKLLEPAGGTSWVLFKLDGGIDHILIDEAQDVTPLQWEIITHLTDEFFIGKGLRKVLRTVFAVGDAKQSIFSFQGVEQSKFAQMHRYFKERVESVQNRWCSVELDISFRSVAAILSCVDATFQDPKAYKGLCADDTSPSRHKAFRSNRSGIVELWPLATPQEHDDTPHHQHELIDQNPSIHLAMAIAQTVRSWLDQKERLHIYNRLIRPGDIMVLVQRRSEMEHLVRAFKDRDIPVSGIDRIVLTEHIAVMDLMVFAQFLLLPEDDLALATLLKSPLIGFNDEKLFMVSYERKSTVWASLLEKQTNDPEIAKVCQYLDEWLSIVDSITPYHLFSRILSRPCPRDEVSGWHAMLSRLGHEIIDPLEELLNLSLSFEQSHVPSLQRFLAWLMIKETSIKRESDQDEQAANIVRLMTVHGAKGLQAPIVFIPDTVYVPSSSYPHRVAHRQRVFRSLCYDTSFIHSQSSSRYRSM